MCNVQCAMCCLSTFHFQLIEEFLVGNSNETAFQRPCCHIELDTGQVQKKSGKTMKAINITQKLK